MQTIILISKETVEVIHFIIFLFVSAMTGKSIKLWGGAWVIIVVSSSSINENWQFLLTVKIKDQYYYSISFSGQLYFCN